MGKTRRLDHRTSQLHRTLCISRLSAAAMNPLQILLGLCLVALGSAQGMGGFGGCSARESQYLFQQCAAPFALAHRQYWNQWRAQGICSTDTIDCGVTYKFLNCMNSIPRNTVSDQCFANAQAMLDGFFTNSGLNCPFTQIRSKCQYGWSPLLQPNQRPSGGMNNFW